MLDKTSTEGYFDFVCNELEKNPTNYSMYFLLGNYYESRNVNQAWLCYDNAEYYCRNNESDLQIIRERKQELEMQPDWCVKKTSIVILSYNVKDICKQCIESIRKTNKKDAYEIIVVDNASDDGIVDWLKEQQDIKLICNNENVGFPRGCNQGIEVSEPENDILLLNNDTIVMPNSLFWLRMGLYEREDVGATGSVTNYAGNNQTIEERFNTLQEYYTYAVKNNIAKQNPYEKKIWLVGFAMLIKRKALNEVGLLDERFTPGGYEDDDIGVRLNDVGWKVLLCKNSFIFHWGHGNGKNHAKWQSLASVNCDLFKKKWDFDITYYTWAREDIISLIDRDKNDSFSVLEIGCGCGATLARIEHKWPNAKVWGIELNEKVAHIGANLVEVIPGNIESMELPEEYRVTYDYIIFGDVLEHLYEPEMAIKRLKPYLKEDGCFLCSIPNLMNEKVIVSLLKGQFEYQESGILDRTHIRFFTVESIVTMMRRCGLRIETLIPMGGGAQRTEEETKILNALYQIPGIAERKWFAAYQYVFSARLRD